MAISLLPFSYGYGKDTCCLVGCLPMICRSSPGCGILPDSSLDQSGMSFREISKAPVEISWKQKRRESFQGLRWKYGGTDISSKKQCCGSDIISIWSGSILGSVKLRYGFGSVILCYGFGSGSSRSLNHGSRRIWFLPWHFCDLWQNILSNW